MSVVPPGRLRDRAGDGHALGAVRVVVGGLLLWTSLLAAERLVGLGPVAQRFHVSEVPAWLVPSPRVEALLVAARLCLAAGALVGVGASVALFGSAALLVLGMRVDALSYAHDGWLLALVALLLAFTPCDRSFSLATSDDAPGPAPFFGVVALQVHVSLVHLASGGAKLLDPRWASGEALAGALGRAAAGHGPAAAVARALGGPVACGTLAKVAIAVELFVCVAPWLRRPRVIALWLGAVTQIGLAFGGLPGAWLTLAAYGAFVTPDRGARVFYYDPTRPKARATAALVRTLDWLGRFTVRPWEPDDGRGHSMVVVARDGALVTGFRAVVLLCRCLPALFPAWGPLALFASFGRGREVGATD